MRVAFSRRISTTTKRTFSCNFIHTQLDATVHFVMINQINSQRGIIPGFSPRYTWR
jgi:hypothetical protein